MFARHPRMGEPARLRQLLCAIPATLPAQGVADARRAATVAGGALAILLAADAAVAARVTASQQQGAPQCCVN